MNRFPLFSKLKTSIGINIIFPYLLLTSIVAAAGAYIVTNLVANSLEERFENQLLDAGRVVSESMLVYEEVRLEKLRIIAATTGVPEGILAGDAARLDSLVPQIIINSPNTDAVIILNKQGHSVYNWQRLPGEAQQGRGWTGTADFSDNEDVKAVLDDATDSKDKRVLLLDTETTNGLMMFTIGPVYQNSAKKEKVGAVMVGTYLREMLTDMTGVGAITLYDRSGKVVETTFSGGNEQNAPLIMEAPERYEETLALLKESPNRYSVVKEADGKTFLRQVKMSEQNYTLAYGDWRIRNQSFGLFSVALSDKFISNITDNNRVQFSLLFSLATLAVFGIGFFVAQRIIKPLNQLVGTAVAVTRGNLKQRTGIERSDEIGTLAHSFDAMTENLVERNSQLQTILNSIADGVIVLDPAGNIVTTNPAAAQILASMTEAQKTEIFHSLLHQPASPEPVEEADGPSPPAAQRKPERYRVGNSVFSALAAPMETPTGDNLGAVIVLRDVTREAEAEYLQDGFITSISHELRTPLTAVKGYSYLLLRLPDTGLSDKHKVFLETINVNADQLGYHINKLIDISEIQGSTLELDEAPVSFPELVESAVEGWRAQIEERDLALEVHLPETDLVVIGDSERLRWAVDNFLSNAYHYTPAGSIKVRVYQEDQEVRLDVTDTGVGIIATDQPYLFSRFFRANTSHEFTFNVEGVGLGLFITRSIIELHHGRVWAKSKAGVGSTFSLALPLAEEE